MNTGDTLADGRYELLAPLGEGGMATVYRARDTRLEVDRAIKVLHPNYGRSPYVRERFEREARIMAQLEHPFICPVHDTGTTAEGELWLVLSLVSGGSLANRVEAQGALDANEAVGIVRRLLDALGAAHAKGVIHRDVKPHNVLIDDHGHPRLTDFGIAHNTQEATLTKAGAMMGTWAYMAPEQRTDAGKVDERADIYAVGATLYALVAGSDPHELHNAEARVDQLQRFPVSLRAFIQRCTRYRPEDRYASAAEARAALDAIGDIDAIIATSPQGFDDGSTYGLTDPGPGPTLSPSGDETEILPDSGAPLMSEQPTALRAPSLPPEARPGSAGLIPVLGVGVVLLVGVVGGLLWWFNRPDAASLPKRSPVPVSAPVQAPVEPEVAPIVEDPPDTEHAAANDEPSDTPPPTPSEPAPRTEPVPDRPSKPAAAPAPTPAPAPEPELSEATVTAFVSARPFPTEVRVDGVATKPGKLSVKPGSHTIEIVATGHDPHRTTLVFGDAPVKYCWDFNLGAICSR